MVFDFNEDRIEMWEQVAAVQVMQAVDPHPTILSGIHIGHDLFRYAGILPSFETTAEHSFNCSVAFRYLATSKMMYPQVLATSAGLHQGMKISPPSFPEAALSVDMTGGIVLCPFEIDPAFQIPVTVWKAVARHLRSTGVKLSLMGDAGQRMDAANFSEGCTLSQLTLIKKMQALASAQLVIGVPNAWTWIATAWGKKIILLHPDNVPSSRWFGFYETPKLGRLLYQGHLIQIPVVLAGLRKILNMM